MQFGTIRYRHDIWPPSWISKLPYTYFLQCNPVNLHANLATRLLLLLCAYQYSLYNNIVIMCVMYKQTRNRDNETECDEEWTRKGQHTFSYCTLSPHAPLPLQSSVHCKFNERYLHWRLPPFLHPQCTRS